VPCDTFHRSEFLRRLPDAVNNAKYHNGELKASSDRMDEEEGAWRNGENVLIVAECDEALGVDERLLIGKAAIAQNAMFARNFIPEVQC
jgi:hypothetical protein